MVAFEWGRVIDVRDVLYNIDLTYSAQASNGLCVARDLVQVKDHYVHKPLLAIGSYT
jgi:hypothetical protein